MRHLQGGDRLVEYPQAKDAKGVEVIAPEELIGLDCEVLIPAALSSAIDAANAGSVRA